MKRRNIFPWLLGLMLLATTSPILTACSSSDDNNSGGNGKEQTDSLTAMYDDLEFLQRSLCLIDSAGKLVRYEIGEAIQENDPQHRYIGVDNIEEAAKIFRCWIAPDVELGTITPSVSNLTAQLTDTQGHAQGTIYFRAGSGQTVAEVTYSPETKLKYIDKITFLLNSAWPYNSGELKWHLGDIHPFTPSGKCGEGLADNDKTLNFVLTQEGGHGLNTVWCAITNNKYTNWTGGDFPKIYYSDYCPTRSSADYITIMLRENWNYFVEKFKQAGCGPLEASTSYWISHFHDGTFHDCMMYSAGYITGIWWKQGEEYFLLKIDWLKDGDFTLAPTGGSEGFPGEGYANLFDNNDGSKWLTLTPRTKSEVSGKDCWWVEFQAYNPPINPYSYLLETGNDTSKYPERNPKSGALYGKKDADSSWTLIDSRANFELPSDNYKWEEYQMNGTRGDYTYFRFEVYEPVGGGSIQLATLYLNY